MFFLRRSLDGERLRDAWKSCRNKQLYERIQKAFLKTKERLSSADFELHQQYAANVSNERGFSQKVDFVSSSDPIKRIKIPRSDQRVSTEIVFAPNEEVARWECLKTMAANARDLKTARPSLGTRHVYDMLRKQARNLFIEQISRRFVASPPPNFSVPGMDQHG